MYAAEQVPVVNVGAGGTKKRGMEFAIEQRKVSFVGKGM